MDISKFQTKLKAMVPEKTFRQILSCFTEQDYMCIPKPDESRHQGFEQLPFDALSEEFLDRLEEVQIAIFD